MNRYQEQALEKEEKEEKEEIPSKNEENDKPLSFKERIEFFSGGNNNMNNKKKSFKKKKKNNLRESSRPLTIKTNLEQLTNKNELNINKKNYFSLNNEENLYNNDNNMEKDNNEIKETLKTFEDIIESKEEELENNEFSKEEKKEIPTQNFDVKQENQEKLEEINKEEIKDNEKHQEINEKKEDIQESLQDIITVKEENVNKEPSNGNNEKKEEYQKDIQEVNKEKNENQENSKEIIKDNQQSQINEEKKFRTEKSDSIKGVNKNNSGKEKENIKEKITKIGKKEISQETERSSTFSKKYSVPIVQSQNLKIQEIQESEDEQEEEEEEKENFLDGISYDKYLSKLKSQNKKEYESGRETFCEGFFIASFPQKEGNVIENSQTFPAQCGHQECSILPSMKPEIISRYPLEDTKTLELNNLAATICFPTGIKVCYSEENPPMIYDYVTPITNQKGERYYMMTYHFYQKITNDLFSKIYEMHPLKHHLMRFGDSYLNLSDKEMDESITNKIQEELEKAQEFGFREYVYVPYCICLISKYRYVTEMKKCLQSIYTMIINHLNDKNLDLNNLIMYLIHSIPIPELNTKVKFFVPYCNKGIELKCPKVQDISVMNSNISYLLEYFSIDYIVIIFRLMLFEKKILFIDNDYTRLTAVTDSFISLLYPFQWVHTYIPIMSDQMIKYLETFLPFLNGINSSLMPLVTEIFTNNEMEDSEEVFLVYININKFRLGTSLTKNNKKKYKYLQENVPALPIALEKDLKFKLKKIKEELDSLIKNNKNHKKLNLTDLDLRIRNAFIHMFVEMFHDYYKYMTFVEEDVVFNKNLFLEKITNNNDKHFYDEFIETQLFQQFSQNIIKDELKYFTSMAMNYGINKRGSLKRALPTQFTIEKLFIIRPDYLQINSKNSIDIEKAIEQKYKMNQPVDEEGIIKSSNRILSQINKIKDEYYNNQNCYIYTIPDITTPKINIIKPNEKHQSSEMKLKLNLFLNIMKKMNLKATKSFKNRGDTLTEKEKDSIKETIKDFTIKIFKSEEIDEEPNQKKELLNALNNYFGRDFFVNMLTKNVTNVILLKEKSFQLLGVLIYNSLLYILNIEETDKLLEQMVILVRSTKYFGKEVKKETITLWDVYKSRIQGYSKVNQANFWNKWYEVETKEETELNIFKKEKYILGICDIMIQLELTKSFVKNVTFGLSEKEFGKESEQNITTNNLITQKIINTKYISKAR